MIDALERLTTIRYALGNRRSELDREIGRRDLLVHQLSTKRQELTEAQSEAELAEQARLLFEQLVDSKREMVRSKIEDLVTYGIQAVYGPDYAFKIEQRLARNQVTFEYKIHHSFDGSVYESDLRGFHGGGLVALVGFLLRLVMVLYTHPPRRRIIFLDETMAALDGDRRAPFAALLRHLGDSLGVQFVFITHSPEYASDADKVYEIVSVRDGVSKLIPQR